MVHFSPLEGDPAFEGEDVVLARARADLEALRAGGVDAVIFENNFDNPKFERLPPPTAAHFERLVADLAPRAGVPWGVAPLWNDYRLGFRLCKAYGGRMVRVPVFADDVETAYGTFVADAAQVRRERMDAGADDVLILADVQVKHARLVRPRAFAESVRDTLAAGADAVIVTGEWTGHPPSWEQCALAKEAAGGNALVLAGSGMTPENISSYAPSLDGYIVGTAFKEGAVDAGSRNGPNVVGPARRYDVEKIRAFVQKAGELRA